MTEKLRRIAIRVSKAFKPKGKYAFICSVVPGGKLLDVGCGNNGPFIVKSLRPDLYYVGVDIAIYNQQFDYRKYADDFIMTTPENFAAAVGARESEFDGVISAQNLEHCNNYIGVTLAMIRSLKNGGAMYISFPCEESVRFPSRRGTLNFFDDSSHRNLIPYTSLLSLLEHNGMTIVFATKRYRPIIPFLVGMACEPLCMLLKRQAPIYGTWAFFGFESIIVGKKR
jgi:2-polyprenyl-3-methyl-5-hydroxy-6-metoxy-1,4-benzoquinol methylase